MNPQASEHDRGPIADDPALTRRAMDSDRAALEAVLKRNWPWLRSLAMSLTAPGDCDDVLQNVCIRVMRKIHTLRDPARLKPWLAAIVKNEAASWHRYARKHTAAALPDEADLPETDSGADLPGGQGHPGLYRALQTLSPTNRQVIWLKYMAGYSYAEMADLLNISVSAVQNRLFRARRQLARILEKTELSAQRGSP